MIVFWVVAIVICYLSIRFLKNQIHIDNYFSMLFLTILIVDILVTLFGFLIASIFPDFEPSNTIRNSGIVENFVMKLPLALIVTVLFFTIFRDKIRKYKND